MERVKLVLGVIINYFKIYFGMRCFRVLFKKFVAEIGKVYYLGVYLFFINFILCVNIIGNRGSLRLSIIIDKDVNIIKVKVFFFYSYDVVLVLLFFLVVSFKSLL